MNVVKEGPESVIALTLLYKKAGKLTLIEIHTIRLRIKIARNTFFILSKVLFIIYRSFRNLIKVELNMKEKNFGCDMAADCMYF